MSDSLYIRVRGKIRGPYDFERLRSLADRGRFGRQHKVSVDGVTWESASNYSELFPVRVERKVRKQHVPEESVDEVSYDLKSQVSEAPLEEVKEEQEWYYTHNDQQFGPAPIDALQLAVANAQLSLNDLVWVEGMPEWAPAGSILPSLFSTVTDTGSIDALNTQNEIVSTQQSEGAKSKRLVVIPMSVASLVLGLLGMTFLFFFGSVLAVIFGHVALNQIKRSEGELGGRGMALSGLIMGYVIIGVVLIALVVRLSLALFGYVIGG